MRRENAFTLVELVITLVILGVIAALVAPKIVNLSDEARIAALKGMEGAMRSGTRLIHSKAIINSKTVAADTMVIDGDTIFLHSGYPVGNWMRGIRYIINLDNVSFSSASAICNIEWCGRGNQTSIPSGVTVSSPGRIGKVYPEGYSWNDACGVYYINREDGSAPQIGVETSGC